MYVFLLSRNKTFAVSKYDICRSFLVQIGVTDSIRIWSISKALTPEVGVELKLILSLFYQAYGLQLNKKLLKQMKTGKQGLYLPRVSKALHEYHIYLKSAVVSISVYLRS